MPFIIKVASIPKERIQVYFIDNDEYFKRKATFILLVSFYDQIQRYSVYSELLEEKLNFESNSLLVNPNFVMNDSNQIPLNGHTFHSINGKNYYENKNYLTNNIAYLNSNNESILSKSMPSTPTLNTNLKPNHNNSNINFNKSPTKSIESVLPTLSVTSSNINTSSNSTNNNSLKKYNNYLD